MLTLMASAPPLWLKVVHRLERAVGSRVESVVHSDPYFDTVTRLRRSQAQLRGTSERVSRDLLHLVNLPTGSDVRRLREQLTRMERRLATIADELEAHEGPARTRDQ
jgi:hypothetical protein